MKWLSRMKDSKYYGDTWCKMSDRLNELASCSMVLVHIVHVKRTEQCFVVSAIIIIIIIILFLFFFRPWYLFPRVWDIKQSVSCLEWLHCGLGNCESVRQADCVETLDCRGDLLVQKCRFTRVGGAQRCSPVVLCDTRDTSVSIAIPHVTIPVSPRSR